MNDDDRVEISTAKLRKSWASYKEQANVSKYALLKAVVAAFKWEYIKIIIINLIVTGLNLISPYLISMIIEYIETKDQKIRPPKLTTGLLYVGMLVLSQLMFYSVSEHLEYYQKVVGVK